MGISSNDSESNNYKLRETVQDELGKTFVYDLVEDDIDETSAWDQAHTDTRLGNALSCLIITLFSFVFTIMVAVCFTPRTPENSISMSPNSKPLPTVYPSMPSQIQDVPYQDVGYLEKTILKQGSVSLKNREQFYRFKLANPSKVSLSLDGVDSEVDIYLYSDKDGTGVIGDNYGYTSAIKSKPGIITKELGAGNYIVVVRLKARGSNYTLTISAS